MQIQFANFRVSLKCQSSPALSLPFKIHISVDLNNEILAFDSNVEPDGVELTVEAFVTRPCRRRAEKKGVRNWPRLHVHF